MTKMIAPVKFLVFSVIICPTMAEVVTQSFVIRLKEMEQLIRDQKQVIKDQREVIDALKSGAYFTVGLSGDPTFIAGETIKFDKIIANVGSGYIDDNNSTDYAKFIVPQNGTYKFNANVYNANELVGADLVKNGALVIAARSMYGGGPASLSAILDLKENDKVYLRRPTWVSDTTAYDKYFTSFS